MAYESCRVLLIEDDGVLAEVIGFRLEMLGYGVETVGSADEALKTVERQLPDVIILDLSLSGMDGAELVNRLSNHKQTGAVPILVLSTKADVSDVEQAHLAGAKDYLVIPFEPTALEHKIETLVRQAREIAV